MEQKLKQIVRIRSADIEGNKSVLNALRKVKGISHSLSNAICNALNIEKQKKVGLLTDEELKKIEEAIKEPSKFNIPFWMFNRQKDYDTNQDLHLTHIDLKLRTDFDIKRLRKIKSYRGMRHAMGLPVRGQRTKAHFRKGKAVGVTKKKKLGKTG
jgi:small subunit ribosomal protein S13